MLFFFLFYFIFCFIWWGFCQLAIPAPSVFRKQSCMGWGGGGDGRKFPPDGFQWLEQIKGHSCFTFNWKQPNCKINPGSTCVHDDSIVTGFSGPPSPGVPHTVPSARKTHSFPSDCSLRYYTQCCLLSEWEKAGQAFIFAHLRVDCKLSELCCGN